MDWFLFDEKKGTCGQFSSAFVVLARSVGIPARVVSGWYIGPVGVPQTVRSNQAHQWAEVALAGPGWTTFDPTAEDGAPFRAPRQRVWMAELERLSEVLGNAAAGSRQVEAIEELVRLGEKAPIPLTPTTPPLTLALESDEFPSVRAGAAKALGTLGSEKAIPPLTQALSDPTPEVRRAAEKALQDLAAEISSLENGGNLASLNGVIHGLGVGATTRQAAQPERTPVFRVEGAAHTRYLRTGVGDRYEAGAWTQRKPVELYLTPRRKLRDFVPLELRRHPDRELALLAWPAPGPRNAFHLDRIQVSPHPPAGEIPAGAWPISLHPENIYAYGNYRPLSITFHADKGLRAFP